MLSEGWGAIGGYFDMSPHVEELLVAGDYLIGRGNYVGAARTTGKPVTAAFAHFWRIDRDKITSVRQVTDSACGSRPSSSSACNNCADGCLALYAQ